MAKSCVRAEAVDGIAGVVPLFRAGRVYFAGQPSAEAIRALAEQENIEVLVNFRDPLEMEMIGLDAGAVCDACGVRYVNIPFGPTFSEGEIEALDKAMNSTEGNIALQCHTSNRVGAIWAAYLATRQQVPTDAAVEIGRSAGMTNPMLEAFVRQFISAREGG